ncbi:MAG: metallophosphoesterase [Myxococcales bacterium]|nr:metallophosphoesterase [Myxococcales bacterium]
MSGIRKVLVVSDLHLGNGGGYDIFAGENDLPALLRSFAGPERCVVLNGDSVDFLMNEDPLELNEARAVSQAQAICRHPASAASLRALGDVLAAGGDVIIRLGNHDIELALPGVQACLRAALGQPAEIAAKLRFERGDKPGILAIGGVRVLLAHGEQNDIWNRVDYLHLPGPDGPPEAQAQDYAYAPGSRLVKTIMNPLKRQHGLSLIDLIKPDFQGGVLTAMAVSPSALKEVFKGSSVEILWQLEQKKSGAATFVAPDPDDLGLETAIENAGLDEDERAMLEAMFTPSTGRAHSFALDFSILQSAQQKLFRSGLRWYAGAQRNLAKGKGQRFYSFEPEVSEWNEAQRLAQKFNVQAVLFGHTHAARFQHADGLCYVNSGTWIRLIQLPPDDADDDTWAEFLALARRNPQLNPEKGDMVPLFTRFTAALVEANEAEGGAQISLVEWKDQALTVHHSARVPAAQGGA